MPLLSRASFRLLPIALVLLATLLPSSVHAQQQRNRVRSDALSETVRMVERDTRGEVLSAERVQYDGRDMHRVKVVEDDGRVRVYLRQPERTEPVPVPPRPPREAGDPRPRPVPTTVPPTRGDDA